MRDRLLEPRDQRFLVGDEWVEPGDLDGVIALFVFPEARQVGDVLRPPAVEKQVVLAIDGGPKRLCLCELRAFVQDNPFFPFERFGNDDTRAVDSQFKFSRGRTFDPQLPRR
jgi:hypothetical protein